MTIRRTLEIAAFCAALLLAALLFRSWLDAHDDQLRLSATLASQKQAIDAADARERDRNASLKDALAQIDALKRAAQNQTPAQLARALQDALQLPQPITVTPPVGQALARPDERRACPNASSSESADCLPPAPQPDPRASSGTLAPTSPPQQGTAPRPKSIFDALFHRFSPRAPADADASSSPPQSPPSPNTPVGARRAAPERSIGNTAPLGAAQRSAGTPVPPAERNACADASHGESSPCLPPTPSSTSSPQPTVAASDRQGTIPPLPGSGYTDSPLRLRSAIPQSSATQPYADAASLSPAAQSATPQSSASAAQSSASAAPSSAAQRSAAKPASPASQSAEIPAADLAPLYDYIQDCRACQLQLAAAKQNATDDAAKIAALNRERDAALIAAKGGSFWLRLKRNAHWLAVGAALGVVTSTAALCTSGHCR